MKNSRAKRMIESLLRNEGVEYTKQLARAYKVNMTQYDYDKLGEMVDRNYFKKYFNIPWDADEDPNYKRDLDFNLKKLTLLR